MIYAKISLKGGNTYTQPLDQLDVFLDEIDEAAENESVGEIWTLELIEMTEEEYNNLPEFDGH